MLRNGTRQHQVSCQTMPPKRDGRKACEGAPDAMDGVRNQEEICRIALKYNAVIAKERGWLPPAQEERLSLQMT